MPDIDALKRYAVVDDDDDVQTLQLCMDAAIDWFRDAGIEGTPTARQYDLGVYMLATHYFEFRGVVYADSRSSVSKANEMIPMGVYSMLHQLRKGY